MQQRNLTESEITLLEAALRIAREEYDRLADTTPDTHPHIAAQFSRQSDQAEELRKLFEDYPRVEVTPITVNAEEEIVF